MRVLRRSTARVLPVDADGRVLLLHGWNPAEPARTFWFTIGAAVEPGETLRAAAARELLEEAGIAVDEALLGEPIETAAIEFTWAGLRFVQDQTFYAIAVRDAEVSFTGQEAVEQATIRLPRVAAARGPGRRRAAGRPGDTAADAAGGGRGPWLRHTWRPSRV